MLVLNEILELNFCGLNINLRKNIITRQRKEIYTLLKDLSSVNRETQGDGDNDIDDGI